MNLSESQISRTVRDFMAAHGWRCIRFQRTVIPGQFSSAEPGCPDFGFIRYLEHGKILGAALVLWIEMKSATDRRSCRCLQNQGTRKRCTVCDQKNWHQRERLRGATVWIVSDFDFFEQLYDRHFSWLHTGETAVGQLDLLAGLRGGR